MQASHPSISPDMVSKHYGCVLITENNSKVQKRTYRVLFALMRMFGLVNK